MHFMFINPLVSAFISGAIAFPAHDANDSMLAMKPRMECFDGTAFYTCYHNKFSGCCSVDPCALPACPGSPSNTDHTRGTYADPSGPVITVPIIDSKTLQTCSPGEHKQDQYSIHTIFPDQQSLVGPSNKAISLSQNSNRQSDRQQLVEFSPLPDGAYNCSLHWSRNSSNSFSVIGSGLAELVAISSVPSLLNFEMVMSMSQGTVGIIDFGSDAEKMDHDVRWVGEPSRCKDMSMFKVGFPEGQEGSVELAQHEGSGYYIKYHCK